MDDGLSLCNPCIMMANLEMSTSVSSFSVSSVSRSSGGPVHEHLEDATPEVSFRYFLSCTRDTETIFRIVHAFTCAGILPSQYIQFTTRANLGTLGPWYISLGELANNKWSDG